MQRQRIETQDRLDGEQNFFSIQETGLERAVGGSHCSNIKQRLRGMITQQEKG